MRYKKTIEPEACTFIDEHRDVELTKKLFKTITDEMIGGKDSGDFKHGMVALAEAVSMYLSMGARKSEPVQTVETVGCLFYDILDFFCFAADHPDKEEK